MATIKLEYFFPDGGSYNLDDKGLERIAELTDNLKASRSTVQDKYSDIEIRIAVHLDSPHYNVYIHGKDEESLKSALSEITKTCGTPNFIDGKFKVVDQVLAEYGKKTKRKFLGFLIGRHVIDSWLFEVKR